MANRNITYGVKLKVDSTDLNSVNNQITDLLKTYNSMGDFGKKFGMNFKQIKEHFSEMGTSFTEVQKGVQSIGEAFSKSYNSKLGTVNFKEFNEEISKSNIDVPKLFNALKQGDPAAVRTFKNMSIGAFTANEQIKQTVNWIEKLKTTFSNTLKWGISSSAMNSFTGSIQTAYNYVNDLDKSLNNIRIVTKMSSEEMANFAQEATKASKALGVATTDYTDAALIYYQQGYGTEEASERARITSLVSNVTGQSTSAVSEQLTSLWNGYNVTLEKTEEYVDKLAAVAAASASDLEELSTGMSKVASSANVMGVSADQLAATLSTIISVTRQAPESVGTALKTIYARMADIESGEDNETSLGNYTAEMANLGINVLNTEGKLRDMGEVIEEVGSKWTKFSREQQLALAQSMAGTRQYNNLIALFDNWEDYEKMLKISESSAGELSAQQDIYMESAAAHIQQMKTSWEDFYDSLFGGSDLNSFYDIIGGIGSGLANIIDSLNGGRTVLLGMLSISTKLLSGPIAKGLATFSYNKQVDTKKANQLQAKEFWKENFANFVDVDDEVMEEVIALKTRQYQLGNKINEDEEKTLNLFIKEKVQLAETEKQLKKNKQEIEEIMKKYGNASPATPENVAKMKEKISTGTEVIGKAVSSAKDYDLKEYGVKEFDASSQLATLIRFIENNAQYEQIISNNLSNFYKETKITDKDDLLSKIEKISNLDSTKLKEFVQIFEQIKQIGIVPENKVDTSFITKFIGDKQKLEEYKEDIINEFTDLHKQLSNVLDMPQETESVKKIQSAIKELKDNFYDSRSKQSKTGINRGTIFEELTGPNAEKIVNALINVQKAYQDFSKEVGDQLGNKIDIVTESLNKNTSAQHANAKQIEENIFGVKEAEEFIENTINGISKLESALTTISATGNFFNILNNKSISAGEKFLQIISNLSFTLPGYLNIFKSLSEANKTYNSIKSITNLLSDAENVKLTKNQTLKIIELALAKKSVTEKELENIVGKDAVKTGYAQVIVQKVLNGEISKGNAKLLQYIMNLKNLVVVWGPVILAFSTAAAMIGAMVYEHEKANIAAEKAAESAKRASDAYKEASSNLEELKSNIDTYKDSKIALDEMTQGTEEWNSKLRETNELVLEMLDKYPELAQYVKTNSEGLLEITDTDKIIEAQQKRTNFASMAANSAILNANQAKLEADKEDFYNKFADKALIQTLGVTVATVGVGMLPAAAATADDYLSEQQIDHLINAINETNGTILSNKEQLIKTYGISDKLAESLLETDNKKELLDMANQLKSNTEQLKLRNQQDFQNYLLSNKEGFSELSVQQQAFVSGEISEDSDAFKKVYNEVLKDRQSWRRR